MLSCRPIMKGTPWAAAALLASLPGCDSLLGEKTHHCAATGAVCPESLACAPAPALCGPPDDVAACAGVADHESCSSAANPVGYCSSGVCLPCSPDQAAICRYPGWAQMTSLADDLWGVWVAGPLDVYVAGDGGVFHYDGQSWTQLGTLPALAKLRAISGSGSHLFVVGTDGPLYEWGGTSWATHAGAAGPLSGVFAASATDVFGVGFSGEIDHFDGAAFTNQTTGAFNDLQAIWGTSGSDVFAAAFHQVAHYNGSAWTASLASTPYALQAISGTGANDIIAVGNCAGCTGTGPAALRYTGSWQAAEPITLSMDDRAQGVWATSSIVFAVGSVTVSKTPLVVKSAAFRRDASGWHVDMLDSQYELNAVAGSSATDVYAVGAHGTIWHYGGP